jgi:trans-aconitate methyltransferase
VRSNFSASIPSGPCVSRDPSRFEYPSPAALVALFDFDEFAPFVDFGAGTGAYAIATARAFPGVRIFALDENNAMLAHVRRSLAEGDCRT